MSGKIAKWLKTLGRRTAALSEAEQSGRNRVIRYEPALAQVAEQG